MLSYHVAEQIDIHKSLTDIHRYLSDMKNWNQWSPWTCMDPNCDIKLSEEQNGVYHQMSWNGKIVGQGNIQIINTDDHTIFYDLSFIKPFKSKAKVSFQVAQKDKNLTTVTWTLDSKVPFFLFFLKNMFQKMIGKDYERGLFRLKNILEKGNIPARLEFDDTPKSITKFNISALRTTLHMSELMTVVPQKFKQLWQTLGSDDSVTIDDGYCFCHKANMMKGTFDMSMALSHKENYQNSTLLSSTIPAHKSIKVTLYGDYAFLKDAWTGIMMHSRALKYKVNKQVPPYEKYIKGPMNTENSDEYITEIHFPIK